MERRLCREREMACDEGVVHQTQAPRAYAACLTSLAERSLKRRSQMLSLGVFERRPELVHRVHSILWRGRALHPLAARAWLGAVSCGLLLGALEMARCPEMVGFVPAASSTAMHNVVPSMQKNVARAETRAAAIAVSQREAASAPAALPRRERDQGARRDTERSTPWRFSPSAVTRDRPAQAIPCAMHRTHQPYGERRELASAETRAGVPHETAAQGGDVRPGCGG